MDWTAGCYLPTPALDSYCSEFYFHSFLLQISFLNKSTLIVSTSSGAIYSTSLVNWNLCLPFHWNWSQQSHQCCYAGVFSPFLLQWLCWIFFPSFLEHIPQLASLSPLSYSSYQTTISDAPEFSISLARTDFMKVRLEQLYKTQCSEVPLLRV